VPTEPITSAFLICGKPFMFGPLSAAAVGVSAAGAGVAATSSAVEGASIAGLAASEVGSEGVDCDSMGCELKNGDDARNAQAIRTSE